MTTALLLIDLQLDYFPAGASPLVEPEAAVEVAARVLERQRASALPIVHIQHIWDEPDATFMRPGTPGVEIHSLVRPRAGEPLVTKTFPNAFRQTDLQMRLISLGVDSLVVVGMMSSMCVDATVRAAADLGYDVTVVHDGCAAPDLQFDGVAIPGAQVHAAFMAALADSYAKVVASDQFLAG
ncbi:cysteine hydrolase family protein [Jatrophihabitans sp. DSM 45814]